MIQLSHHTDTYQYQSNRIWFGKSLNGFLLLKIVKWYKVIWSYPTTTMICTDFSFSLGSGLYSDIWISLALHTNERPMRNLMKTMINVIIIKYYLLKSTIHTRWLWNENLVNYCFHYQLTVFCKLIIFCLSFPIRVLHKMHSWFGHQFFFNLIHSKIKEKENYFDLTINLILDIFLVGQFLFINFISFFDEIID